MAKICDMDCFNCKFPDCINDKIPPERKRYCDFTEEQKARRRERDKQRYYKLKAEGICTRCKHRPQYHGVLCYECYLKVKRQHQKSAYSKRDYWRENGLCYFCGKPVVPGKKTCSEHLEICRKFMTNARANRGKTSHPWVADERVRRVKIHRKEAAKCQANGE